MVFSSITFLYYFLPLFFLLYFLLPDKHRNVILFFGSLFFYAWGEPVYLYLMCILTLTGYIGGLLIDKYKTHNKKMSRLILLAALALILAALIFFKYAVFFIQTLAQLTGRDMPMLSVVQPIGISFYTFQLISYVTDVYRGEIAAQKNLLILFTYVTMFPQLIAGPIVRYRDIENQLKERKSTFTSTRQGIIRFVTGLGKKTIFANELYGLIDIIEKSTDKTVLLMWIYGITVCLYIYYDFSGYSDMAIGLGKIMGFTYPENFNYPFISGSITEFWRRWHITLGSWFRDYIYFPMGGSRVSRLKLAVNLLIVWLLTGLWHGAAWNFIIWGLFFAFLLIIEKICVYGILKKTVIFKHIYVIIVLILSFVMFNADSVGEGFDYIGKMLGNAGYFSDDFTIYYLKSYVILLLFAIIGATPVKRIYTNLKGEKKNAATEVTELVYVVAVLFLSTACIVNSSFNPFMYFRF